MKARLTRAINGYITSVERNGENVLEVFNEREKYAMLESIIGGVVECGAGETVTLEINSSVDNEEFNHCGVDFNLAV